MKLELRITDARWPYAKVLGLYIWNDYEGGVKRLQEVFDANLLPKELLKSRLKENVMKVIEEEVGAYIDKALDDN